MQPQAFQWRVRDFLESVIWRNIKAGKKKEELFTIIFSTENYVFVIFPIRWSLPSLNKSASKFIRSSWIQRYRHRTCWNKFSVNCYPCLNG